MGSPVGFTGITASWHERGGKSRLQFCLADGEALFSVYALREEEYNGSFLKWTFRRVLIDTGADEASVCYINVNSLAKRTFFNRQREEITSFFGTYEAKLQEKILALSAGLTRGETGDCFLGNERLLTGDQFKTFAQEILRFEAHRSFWTKEAGFFSRRFPPHLTLSYTKTPFGEIKYLLDIDPPHLEKRRKIVLGEGKIVEEVWSADREALCHDREMRALLHEGVIGKPVGVQDVTYPFRGPAEGRRRSFHLEPYFGGGTLADVRVSLSEQKKLSVARRILLALVHMHEVKQVVHRNVSLSSIRFLEEEEGLGLAFLTDFSRAKCLQKRPFASGVLNQAEFTRAKKEDIEALGLVFEQMGFPVRYRQLVQDMQNGILKASECLATLEERSREQETGFAVRVQGRIAYQMHNIAVLSIHGYTEAEFERTNFWFKSLRFVKVLTQSGAVYYMNRRSLKKNGISGYSRTDAVAKSLFEKISLMQSTTLTPGSGESFDPQIYKQVMVRGLTFQDGNWTTKHGRSVLSDTDLDRVLLRIQQDGWPTGEPYEMNFQCGSRRTGVKIRPDGQISAMIQQVRCGFKIFKRTVIFGSPATPKAKIWSVLSPRPDRNLPELEFGQQTPVYAAAILERLHEEGPAPYTQPPFQIGEGGEVVTKAYGYDLKQYVASQSPSEQQIVQAMLRAAQAVQHAHTKGVYHLDIKPMNILGSFHKEEAKIAVIDWEGSVVRSEDGLQMGSRVTTTCEYCVEAERQALQKGVAGRTVNDLTERMEKFDVFSLGISLAYLLLGENGKEAFRRERPSGVRYADRLAEIVQSGREDSRVEQYFSHVDSDLMGIIQSMMHPNWQERIRLPEAIEALENWENLRYSL